MNCLHYNLVHTRILETDKLGIEENFGSTKAFCANLRKISLWSTVAQGLKLTFNFCPSGSV